MSCKPTIVLVPGAWHRSMQYTPLTSRLQQSDYHVYAIDCPSTAPKPLNLNFEPDVATVSQKLSELSDRGDDIVLVAHSIGGLIAGEAAKGFSKTDRATEGRPGGITAMVYISAFAAPEGVSLYDAIGGPAEWHVVEGAVVRAASPRRVFYNKCAPEIAEANTKQLQLFAKGTFESRPSYAAWKHIPTTYLVCENDNAIPLVVQEAMTTQEGANFSIVRCDADHSPFLSMPELTADVIRQAAGEVL